MNVSRAKCRVLLAATGAVVLFVPATPFAAFAGLFDPANSSIEIAVGSGPRVVIPMTGGSASLSSGPSGLRIQFVAPVASFAPSTSLFAGLPPLTTITGTIGPASTLPFTFQSGVSNTTPWGSATYTGFGLTAGPAGQNPFLGTATWTTPTSATFTLDLARIGPTGTASGCPGVQCIFGRLHTGPAVITGLSTPRVSVVGVGTGAVLTLRPTANANVRVLTTGGGFTSTGVGPVSELGTLTLSGTNTLPSTNATGAITLVSPMRIDTGGIDGVLPGEVRIKLAFVPEPGLIILQGASVVTLLFLAERKRRQRRRDRA